MYIMVDPKGYYKILDVNQNSDNETIKQAYRKLAMKWHPDKNPNDSKEAEEKFKKISEAYAVLNDKQKKKNYDIGLSDNKNHFDVHDIPNFFNIPDIFQNYSKPKDMVFDIYINMEDVYFGKNIEKHIEKKIICKQCNGEGHNNKATFDVCEICNGNGEIIKLETILPGMMKQIKKKCVSCNGKGRQIKNEFICHKCKGEKCYYTQINKKIRIEKGITENSQLIYENEGYLSLNNKTYGKLIINILLNPHTNFNRIGNHLLYENEIQLIDALCGYQFNITKINGEIINCCCEKILSHYNVQIIYNEGLPIYKQNNYGHLIIKTKIIFPKEISEKRKEFLYKILATDKQNNNKSSLRNVSCHILNETQSSELINRINNKNTNTYQNEQNDNPNLECVQM